MSATATTVSVRVVAERLHWTEVGAEADETGVAPARNIPWPSNAPWLFTEDVIDERILRVFGYGILRGLGRGPDPRLPVLGNRGT